MKAFFIACTILMAAPALADPNFTPADRQMSAKSGLPVPLPIDPLGLNGAGTAAVAPTGPLGELAELLNSDFIDAAKAATVDPDLQDVNGAACWTAFEPLSRVIKEHPIPLTLRLARDIESLRRVNIMMQRLCAVPACTAVFSEAAAWAQRIAQVAPIHVNVPGLQVNAWAKVCADLPSIQVPVTPAAATAVVAPGASVAAPAAPATSPSAAFVAPDLGSTSTH